MKAILPLIAITALPFAAMAETAIAASDKSSKSAEATPTGAAGYVAAAGASDLYEIESSRLALQKAQSEGVRRFAQMMVDHHTDTTRTVTTAARSAGLTPPPPALMPKQRKMIEQLRSLSGAAFDRAYVVQQRQAHQMALVLHRSYAEGGDSAALKQTARAAVPIIEQHIAALKAL